MDPESWNEFRKILEAQSIEIYEKQLMSSVEVSKPLERLLADQGCQVSLGDSFIKVAHYRGPEEGLIQVCRPIERRIVR